jgi:UDP-N-acetyl-D-mannosaminuronate dehydrogenase
MGAGLKLFDPYYRGEMVFGNMVEASLEKAVSGSDCMLIGTAHKEIRSLDVKMLARLSNMPAAIVDTSQAINPNEARKAGLVYRGVGRV